MALDETCCPNQWVKLSEFTGWCWAVSTFFLFICARTLGTTTAIRYGKIFFFSSTKPCDMHHKPGRKR